MQDQWTDRLSEYVDGDLDAAQRSALEAHLADCGQCRATLAELRRVVDRARAMDERPPARDLWPGIAGRIGLSTDELAVRRARRRISFTVPQLIAAGIALIAVSVGTARLVSNKTSTPSTTASASPRLPAVQAALWSKADSSADQEVDELRLALAEGQRSGQLHPATIRKLERSLAVIDSAIAEAKRALALDPQSPYLNHHLADTMRRKLEFLREANRIATART
ncbi:MAG TPA: zf-HC2 domain-containing protein [Gemmatimonadales bacterium]|nr:zf-HC2 domain-containing protein [Gemmatimonadales bacterium]